MTQPHRRIRAKAVETPRVEIDDGAIDEIDLRSRDRIGLSTLERYTGSDAGEFQPYVLLTNFRFYLNIFSKSFDVPIRQGSVMRACHSLDQRITLVDYGVGSPMAALIMELLSFIETRAVVMLGMCGGLRDEFEVGDFFNPMAAIRGEGTSDSFMPPQSPSLSSFVIQRYCVEAIEACNLTYHTGVIHTTNVRFWEFNEKFKEQLAAERVQAVDMECATLFTVGFAKQVPIGALMLISDVPLKKGGIKTKESANTVFTSFTNRHVDLGVSVMKSMQANETDGFGYQF